MTEQELADIIGRAVGMAATHPDWSNVTSDVMALVAEVRHLEARVEGARRFIVMLQEQVTEHCNRIAAQSELLSKRAELAKSVADAPVTMSLPMEVMAKAEGIDGPAEYGEYRNVFNPVKCQRCGASLAGPRGAHDFINDCPACRPGAVGPPGPPGVPGPCNVGPVGGPGLPGPGALGRVVINRMPLSEAKANARRIIRTNGPISADDCMWLLRYVAALAAIAERAAAMPEFAWPD